MFQIRIKFQRGWTGTYSTEGPNQLKVVFDSSFTAIHDFKGVDFCLKNVKTFLYILIYKKKNISIEAQYDQRKNFFFVNFSEVIRSFLLIASPLLILNVVGLPSNL
jgi:hypothetical protein